MEASEFPVHCTECLFNTNANRIKLMSYIFETLESPAFYISIQPVLSLYAFLTPFLVYFPY